MMWSFELQKAPTLLLGIWDSVDIDIPQTPPKTYCLLSVVNLQALQV